MACNKCSTCEPAHTTDVYVGNCIHSFDEDGDCVNDDLPWSDVTEFAQAIQDNETTPEFIVGNIKIKYDAESDVHDFFLY